MIKLFVNHPYGTEAANIVRLFYGKTQIEIVNTEALDTNQSFFLPEELELYSIMASREGKSVVQVMYLQKDQRVMERFEAAAETDKQLKETVKLAMYKLLSKKSNKSYPWGILTGIRPVKIIHELMDKGYEEADIKGYMKQHYLVKDAKAQLIYEIARRERSFIYPIDPKSVSIYIGIPFCPTRCHYCSFTSNSLKACGGLVEEYLEALFYEMKQTGAQMHKYGLKVQTIYIGGGTPTSLNEEQLDRLLAMVQEVFGDDFEEYTCEAGRPDTITAGKLSIMKQRGVSRISINPQSMNDDTLARIGRAHDTAQTIESFMLARNMGFENINMDIILGLPGENLEHLKHTLEFIGKLNPESITVHTMAIKKASILIENLENVTHADSILPEMMQLTEDFIAQLGLVPYYLYRQKHMIENLENVGYCKPGYECIYNIQIIEEKQTNIAFGADAITKTVYHDENRIERQGNIKDLRLYISRISEQVEKKLRHLKLLYDKE